jgi:hypothetical protein
MDSDQSLACHDASDSDHDCMMQFLQAFPIPPAGPGGAESACHTVCWTRLQLENSGWSVVIESLGQLAAEVCIELLRAQAQPYSIHFF